jgi:hypothetical protein
MLMRKAKQMLGVRQPKDGRRCLKSNTPSSRCRRLCLSLGLTYDCNQPEILCACRPMCPVLQARGALGWEDAVRGGQRYIAVLRPC